VDKLKVGIIGTGMAFERLHYPAYQELSDKYQIVALCDTNPEKVQKWGKRVGIKKDGIYTDYRQMLGRNDLTSWYQ